MYITESQNYIDLPESYSCTSSPSNGSACYNVNAPLHIIQYCNHKLQKMHTVVQSQAEYNVRMTTLSYLNHTGSSSKLSSSHVYLFLFFLAKAIIDIEVDEKL